MCICIFIYDQQFILLCTLLHPTPFGIFGGILKIFYKAVQLLCFHCFHLLLLVCYMLNHKDCTCAIYKKFQIIWSYVPKGFIGCFLLACS